ncbi:MAG: hypothetical protein IKK34_08030 [Clostridia bacterium]|nr:hypothetical protein [Clostridia bacterium]
MLRIWDAIEADFLRDYGIDLVEQLDGMTWRRFLILCRNLSPNGAVAVRIRAQQDLQEEERDETDEERDRRQAAAFFSSVISV